MFATTTAAPNSEHPDRRTRVRRRGALAGLFLVAAGLSGRADDAVSRQGDRLDPAAPPAAQATTATTMATSPEAGRAPNVVLILADDLGYGDLASYGHPLIRTPRLDQLASEGIRLTSYYAGAPLCTPSRAALLTGRYPIRVGLPKVLVPQSTNGLPRGETTLADALKGRGYRTQMVGKWHLGHATPDMLPTAHGFDHWLGLLYSNDMMPPFAQTAVPPLRLYRDTTPIEGEVDQDELTVRYTEEAVRFINESAGGGAPFFLYLAHSMPHLPIHAPARFRGKSAAGLYGDVIEMLDWSTGQILDVLAARGLAQNTIVIFTSDNGPWLDLPARMLQGGNEPWHAGSSGLLRGAKGTTWEGGIRVPAIVRWPGRVPAGQVSAALTTSMDLNVTLTTAAGAAVPPGRDGHDITPLLAGRTTSSRTESPAGSPTGSLTTGSQADTFFYFQDANLQGVREGPWKLRKAGNEPPALFHLDLDPSEQFDRAKEHPEIVDRLLARMTAFAATLAREGHAPANYP
jgi:arylsulfatase A-like enzyme